MRLKNMPARDTSSNRRRPFLWYPSMYLCAGIVNRKFANPKPVEIQKSVERRVLLAQARVLYQNLASLPSSYFLV